MGRNVLIIADYAAPYEGNFIACLRKLEQLVKTSGGEYLYCLAPEATKTDWTKNLNNVCFFERDIINNVRFLNDIIRKNKIDVIYTHFCETKTLAAVNVVRILNPHVKVVEHFHNHFENSGNSIKKIMKKIVYMADLYIGCSEGVAKSLPYTKNKTCYINNGLFFPRLNKHEKLNLTAKEDFKILMFGHTFKRKGVDIAIRAIQKLKNSRIKLFISVSIEKDEFASEIRDEFGIIPDFVEILEPRNDIGTYYRNVDLFISPSREEGLCYSPLEAMYCGTPCICSDIDGHARDIPDLILFKSENVDGLSRAIKTVYDGENQFDKKKVKKYLEDNYSVDAWAEKVLEILS